MPHSHHLIVRLKAACRHPFNSKKRKIYRSRAGLHAAALDPPRYFEQLKERHFERLQPLSVVNGPVAVKRVTLVTDSLSQSHLFGGVGTAIILCALLAGRLRASLRIVTRTDPSNAGVVEKVLNSNGVMFNRPVELLFAPPGGASVPVSRGDIFIPMSWWTVRSVLGSISRNQIAYILQEDERMFYPHGDDRVRCFETLSERNFPVIVNSKLLFDHLTVADPIPGLKTDAIWFEPANVIPRMKSISPVREKRKLFFYARPDNPRNLFWRGLECICDGIERGILRRDEWQFNFVGRDIPQGLLPGGVDPIRWEGLSWDSYQSLVRTMDLGISLMDTPHPSYPPLDLAASGAAVLTTASLGKRDLSMYSENIIVVGSDLNSLRAGLKDAVRLAKDDALRFKNCQADKIERDWNKALDQAVTTLCRHFSSTMAMYGPVQE